MDEQLQLLKELTEATGVSGDEGEVRTVMRRHLASIAGVERDNLGSIIFRRDGLSASPRVMLAAHMDEIGFMVTLINKDGFLKFVPLGRWWEQVLPAQRVIVKTQFGNIPGVIGSRPPHLLDEEERKKSVPLEDMFIDIGALGRKEAEKMGVAPGDPVVPDSRFTVLQDGRCLMAKAWDDRVGCALVVDVLRRLNGSDYQATVFGVGTVQEEVGLRGAQTAAEVVNPDLCIVLEVDIAGDLPGQKEDQYPRSRLGKGPVLYLIDASMIAPPRLRRLVLETARELDIPCQFGVMTRGSTDAGKIHLHARGVPSVVVGVPTRYIHSHTGIINLDDYHRAVALVTAIVKKVDQRLLQEIND